MTLRHILASATAAFLLASSPLPARAAAPSGQTFVPVVKKAAPAVVNIFTRQSVTVMESPFAGDPFFQQFSALPGFGQLRQKEVTSLGSGVIIDPAGTIVTSHHVIKDAQSITVILSDKREFDAKVVLKDPKADLAFLAITSDGALPSLALRNSDTLEVGETVLAIGNPFGVGQTVTSGIVSALARRAEGVSDYSFFIQTDAAINPGNSGGALVDMEGKLIGINTAIYSRSGGSQGIGFAIPANMVAALQAQKGEGGSVVRPWMGMSGKSVTGEIAESLGMKTPRGVLVEVLHPESPAAKAGMQVGDVILTFAGSEISGGEDLQYRIALAKIGDKASCEVLRAGKTISFEIPFIAPPSTPAPDERTLEGKNPLSGLAVANLSPALAQQLGLPDSLLGVIVLGRAKNTGLDIGIGRGDILLAINGESVTSTQQLAKLLKKAGGQWQITYQRGGQPMTLNVSIR